MCWRGEGQSLDSDLTGMSPQAPEATQASEQESRRRAGSRGREVGVEQGSVGSDVELFPIFIFVSPLICCMSSGKQPHFSAPQTSHWRGMMGVEQVTGKSPRAGPAFRRCLTDVGPLLIAPDLSCLCCSQRFPSDPGLGGPLSLSIVEILLQLKHSVSYKASSKTPPALVHISINLS